MIRICIALLLGISLLFCHATEAPLDLEKGFADPPPEARLRAFWWWLNGNVTTAAITRDLEEMKAKGFGGALIMDAGGAEQDGNGRVPHGPTFFSPEWRELFKHTLREADRLGLEISLNIQSGWNLGGPMVGPDDSAKKLVWSESRLTGPTNGVVLPPQPKSRDGYYRDLFLLAYPIKSRVQGEADEGKAITRRPLLNWEQKAMHRTLHFSAPDTSVLFQDLPAELGEEDVRIDQVLDLTGRADKEGNLQWEVPGGEWQLLRFGCTIGDHSRVSTSSEGWQGYALDVLDAGAFQRYWQAVVEPLLAEAGPMTGKALKYLHTDSWEVEPINWTSTLRQEFLKRRGYDFLRFLPAMAGRIVNSREESNRFYHDYRKTLADLAVDNHFALFRKNAQAQGLGIHPESGGPHAVPIDAQRNLGMNDVPMSEFWAWSWRHRVGDSNRFFVKQPASAAHVYGHKFVAAEGFTTIGPHWQERIWDNLKPSFDRACCEGLNRLVWHTFTCSPEEMGLPGQEYFAGTHFNPNSTWWEKSGAFLTYINRCQFMLQQGLFVADVAYYYGDHAPNFSQLKMSDPARILPGYDYDVITEEAILTRLTVRDGRLVLPDGMSYRLLVLPNRSMISLPVLRKLKEFVAEGATVVGPSPSQASTLYNYPQCDEEVQEIARELWQSNGDPPSNEPDGSRGRSPHQSKSFPPADGGNLSQQSFNRGASVPANRNNSSQQSPNGGASVPASRNNSSQQSPNRGASVPASRNNEDYAQTLRNPPSATGSAQSLPNPRSERVISRKTARQILLQGGILPDFEFSPSDDTRPSIEARKTAGFTLDYIHRRTGNAEIYFVANRSNQTATARCTFRVSGLAPELWNPVTGERRFADVYEESHGRTTVPLEFAPCGSWFVLFRQPVAEHPASRKSKTLEKVQTLEGGWAVQFDPKWGGPPEAEFQQLISWTQRPESEIKFYSGTAVYRKQFDLSDQARRAIADRKSLLLDLGEVCELAEVRLNGTQLGIVWAPPFRVDVTEAVRAEGNTLEIEVVNFWPNRIIGDQFLPEEKRFTKTNIRKLTKETPLMKSGLLGPVRLLIEEALTAQP